MIEIYKPGTIVTTKIGGIKGMLTAVVIKFDEVKYEITYFANGDQRAVLMHEQEFLPHISPEKLQIGFKQE